MSHKGNIQLTVVFTATPDLVAEGDRIFNHHAGWMAESHHTDGDKALMSYNVSKCPERSNPLDPNSPPTENTNFVLMEVYKTQAGLDDHWKRGAENWSNFGAFVGWAGKCKVTSSHGAEVIHSLW